MRSWWSRPSNCCWMPASGRLPTTCTAAAPGGTVGDVWKRLPAARLGQRASAAFVGTPARRAACEANLRPHDLGYYLDAVGLFAMYAGDLITAREYMRMAISFYRGTGDSRNLAISLKNFSECLEVLGEIDGAAAAATESLSAASVDGEWQNVCNAHAAIGWLAAMTGDPAKADEHFTAADRLQVANDLGRRSSVLAARQPLGRLAGPQRTDGRCAGADEPRAGDRPAVWLECRRGPCRTAAGPARPGRRGRQHSRPAPGRGGGGLPGWRLPHRARRHAGRPGRSRAGQRGPRCGPPVCRRGDQHRRAAGDWCSRSRRARRARPDLRQPGHERPAADACDDLARGRDAADAALRLATGTTWPGTNSAR